MGADYDPKNVETMFINYSDFIGHCLNVKSMLDD
jgi:hypothetical protein